MNDKPMSRKETEDLIKLTALEMTNKFTAAFTSAFNDFAEKQKEDQRLAREHVFEQSTGYSWENRGHFKSIIVWARQAQKNASMWRYGSIVAIIGLAIKSFWKDITGG